jgi:hypothetical protein
MVKPPLEILPPVAGRTSAKRLATFNITLSLPQSENTNDNDQFHAFDPTADRNIPYTIFENLKQDEDIEDDEEKIHIPREDQSELSARFRKYSTESSVRPRRIAMLFGCPCCSLLMHTSFLDRFHQMQFASN